MDSLKALLAQKKAEKVELVGDKKYVRRGELEEARLKRLREEEAAERRAKEEAKRRRRQLDGGGGGGADGSGGGDGAGGGANGGGAAAAAAEAAAAAAQADADAAKLRALAALPRAEVLRRLRALKQPVTLFGEDDGDRVARLARVEREAALVEDDARGGGQQENTLLALQREGLLKQQRKGGGGGGGGDEAAAAAAAAGAGGGGGGTGKQGKGGDAAAATGNKGEAAPGPDAAAAAGGKADGAAAGDGDANADADAAASGAAAAAAGSSGQGATLADAFAAAAARVAEQRAEASMCVEDKIAKYLKRWVKEWGDDLEARSDEAKASAPGHHATVVYRQSLKFLEPLWRALDARAVEDELKVGLWMMVDAMRQRNYLAANDVYLKLAIGNSPWPIGVTSVGIHERSAREKISHVMNGRAHIMNDEATRKYFQAVKRLMTNLQRLYPTDPSRSVDFNLSSGGEGRGATGGGSEKAALLEAEQRGEDWRRLGLAAAPHHMARDGSVAIPPRWDNILKREMARAGVAPAGSGSDDDGGGAGGGGGGGKGSGRPITPPGKV